ncbi:hypothetical protein COCOBI_04-7350 [Coccomyxa sp. Obi]|nr:hypothetical protein COCOBI_04-7350 [Coccomyxa sp. Obi]
MAPSTPTRALSPARGIHHKALKHLKRIYRTSPRRCALLVGITLLKVTILLTWALPRIFPWQFLQGNVPSINIASVRSDPHLLARGLGQARVIYGHGASKGNGTHTEIVNEVLWKDDNNEVIQAHGGSILYHEGVYYWYGENKGGPTLPPGSGKPPSIVHRVDVIGISCYSSQDLINWHYEGLALRAGQHPDLAPSKVVERPRVLYNDMTKRYVMWMHLDEADYELARCGTATATAPQGPFTYRGSFRPHGHMCRDFTVFKDDDNSAYIAYSSEDNKVMHISQLSKDYVGVTQKFIRTMIGMSREAPAMFKYKGLYLMLTSGCTGWNPNRAEIFFARSPMGEWESLGNPCIGGTIMARQSTFFSQGTYVLPMPGRPNEYVFLADRWVPTNLGNSRYIWLPMWVLEVPGVDGTDIALSQQRIRRRQRFRSMRFGTAAANNSIPPIDVIVRWHQKWNLSALNEPPPLCGQVTHGHFESLYANLECAL